MHPINEHSPRAESANTSRLIEKNKCVSLKLPTLTMTFLLWQPKIMMADILIYFIKCKCYLLPQ